MLRIGIWWSVLIVLIGLCVSRTEAKLYRGYKIFNLEPQNDEVAHVILEFIQSKQRLYDVWSAKRHPGASITLSVSPEGLNNLTGMLQSHQVPYDISDLDIEREITEQRRQKQRRRFRRSRTYWKSDHHSYRTVDEIYNAIEQHARKNAFVQKEVIGHTFQGRPIMALWISKDIRKPMIWIDAAIHAREWITPAATMYFIDRLLSWRGERLLNDFQFYIVPLVNPDGYYFTHQVDRMWRKNRSKTAGDTCVGVDLNRNFPVKWGGTDTSADSCENIYRGPEAASELECKAVIKRLSELADKIVLYLNLHSFGRYILTPYGFKRFSYPENYGSMMDAATQVREEIIDKYNNIYRVGSASDLLYEASGGAEDYASVATKIPYSYTIELCDAGRYGFLLPPTYITTVGAQLWTAVKVFARYIQTA